MEKQCNCQTSIREHFFENLRAEQKEPVYLRFKFANIADMNKNDSLRKTGQEIEFKYQYNNKKGESKTKTETAFVTHTYCPFCGNKY